MPVVNISKQLVGVEAIEYLGTKYDWNVYCPDANVMNIIAYRQRKCTPDGDDLCADYTNEVIFKQELTVDWDKFIGIALDDEQWTYKGWYEYDSWEGDPAWIVKLYTESTPFAEWFEQNIVDYEIQ